MQATMLQSANRRALPGAPVLMYMMLIPLTCALATTAWAQEGATKPAETIASLVQEGRLDEAAEAACRWASDDPGDLEALEACARLGRRTGRYRAAEDALRALLFFEPNVPSTLVKLGDVLADEGRYEDAREQFQAAIHLDDCFAPAYTGLARIERYTSEVPADVLSAAEVALSVGPDTPGALTVMGSAQLEAGHYQRALQWLQRAVAADEHYAPAWFELGLAHVRAGDVEAARQAWRRYVQLEPATGEAWRLRHGLIIADEVEVSDRCWYACFSPDGRTLAYRARGRGGWGIYVRPADLSRDEKLLWATEANIQSLDWSPDGTRLLMRVYEKVTVEQNGQQKKQWIYRLMLLPADGSADARTIYEGRWLGEPAWIGDTGRIALRTYVRKTGYIMTSIDPATGEQTQLPGIDSRMPFYTPRWSADGKRVLMVRRGPMHPDGTYSYQLLTGRHPYGKKPAPKARELGLKPEPLAKLDKRQNKGLLRGLALFRGNAVKEFLDAGSAIFAQKSQAP